MVFVADIIYENIKHAFFQPAEKSLIVVIHFHLHSEIMIGKKKSQVRSPSDLSLLPYIFIHSLTFCPLLFYILLI